MNIAGRRVALGEEKGLFPVLVDSGVNDEDGVTEKLTFAGVDEDVPAWISSNVRGCISREREKVPAMP